MKRFMCIFFAVIMCLGFVGCKEEESSPPAETEMITPQAETEMITPQAEVTIPPVETETPPSHMEIQPQGEQEGGGDVSQDKTYDN